MTPYSLRRSADYPAGNILLETRFADKTVPLLLSHQPDALVAANLLPASDTVRLTHLNNLFSVTRDLGTTLGAVRAGETLLIVCTNARIYHAALKWLNVREDSANDPQHSPAP